MRKKIDSFDIGMIVVGVLGVMIVIAGVWFAAEILKMLGEIPGR